MKKIYQKPEIEMVLIAQTLLQSTSNPGFGDDISEGEGDVKKLHEDYSRPSAGSVWDDDWSR